MEMEKALVGAFSGHCKTSRRLADSSIHRRSCYAAVRAQVTWSLVTPLARPPRAANIQPGLGSGEVSCTRHREVLASLVRSVGILYFTLYLLCCMLKLIFKRVAIE